MSSALSSEPLAITTAFDVIVSDQETFDPRNICLKYTDVKAPVQGILVHIRRATNGQAVFCKPEKFSQQANKLFNLRGTLDAARAAGNPIKMGTFLKTMPAQDEWVMADTLFQSQRFLPRHAETPPLMISAQIPNDALYVLHRQALQLRQRVFTRRTKRDYNDFHNSADWIESGIFEEQFRWCLSRERDTNLYRWYNLHKDRIAPKVNADGPKRRGW